MPWDNTPARRAASARTYNDPEYRANRKLALKRAAGRCEECGTDRRPLQVDHEIPVSQGGGHTIGNLKVRCSGQGSCHARKTATEGGGYRKSASDPQPRSATQW